MRALHPIIIFFIILSFALNSIHSSNIIPQEEDVSTNTQDRGTTNDCTQSVDGTNTRHGSSARRTGSQRPKSFPLSSPYYRSYLDRLSQEDLDNIDNIQHRDGKTQHKSATLHKRRHSSYITSDLSTGSTQTYEGLRESPSSPSALETYPQALSRTGHTSNKASCSRQTPSGSHRSNKALHSSSSYSLRQPTAQGRQRAGLHSRRSGQIRGRESSSSEVGARESDNSGKLVVHTKEYHRLNVIYECCIFIQELLDIASDTISKLAYYWTGDSSLIKEMITQAITAFSIIYNLLSACKVEILKIDPTNSMALTVATGPRFDEESLLNCERPLDINSLMQYRSVLATINKYSSEMEECAKTLSKLSGQVQMDKQCLGLSISTCRNALISILNIKLRVLSLEIGKLQLAVDVYTVNSGFDESEQGYYDKYVLGVSVMSPKDQDGKSDDT